MALTQCNSLLAPPRSIVASPQPFPSASLSFYAPSSTCFLSVAKRNSAAMGSSSSVIARASSSSLTNLSITGFDKTVVDALGNIQVLAASTGKPVFFKDLWDQKEIDLQNTPFTMQLGRGANIRLVNVVINTGDAGVTIQFGSLDLSAITA